MKKTSKIILVIFIIFLLLILLIVSIKYNIHFLLKTTIYIILIFSIYLIFISFILIKYNLFKSLNRYRYYRCLKEEKKNIFNELYIDFYNNKYNKFNNIINNIDEIYLKFKHLVIIYSYKGFKINLILNKNSLKYYIIYPDNYIYKDIHIKDINIDLNINKFYLEIKDKLKLIENEIDYLFLNVKKDNIFNGKTFKMLKKYLKSLKIESVLVIILSILLLTILNVFLIFAFKEDKIDARIIVGAVFVLLFDILGIIAIIVSVYKMYLVKLIRHDFNNKIINNINSRPLKIKFMRNYCYKIYYINGLILYYDNIKLKVLFNNNYDFNKRDYKEIKEKLLNKTLNLIYLTNSKIVIFGYDEYLKIVDRYAK